MSDSEEDAFIRANTQIARSPLVAEFALYLATEITPIWQATEDWLQLRNIAPPFWAFAWPGSQALARHILDHPDIVAGRQVLDFAAGCGLAALAASRAGAAAVEAAEIDRLAVASTRLNAALNGLSVVAVAGNIVGRDDGWDVILCGDICYEAPMTRHIMPWLRALHARGAEVWVADPGRAYLPQEGLLKMAVYEVPTTLELEDHTHRRTTLYRLATLLV